MWKQFTITSEERVHRLETAVAFHSSAEKVSVVFLRRKISYQNLTKQNVRKKKVVGVYFFSFLNIKKKQKEEFKHIFLMVNFNTQCNYCLHTYIGIWPA